MRKTIKSPGYTRIAADFLTGEVSGFLKTPGLKSNRMDN
jgi:hypothetical protein